MAIRWGSKYKCKWCNEEFVLTRTKAGYVNECGECGEMTEEDKGNTRPGARMVYDHKTAPVIEIVSNLNDMKQILKRMDRAGGQGTTPSLRERR